MKPNCACISSLSEKPNPELGSFVRYGFFYRKSDSRRIPRWRCKFCRRTYSSATFDPRYRQKRRRLNEPLYRLLCSGVSQRRAAMLLGCNQKTVVRKFLFLAQEKRQENLRFLRTLEAPTDIYFDEMESVEHSKWKPVSIALLVDEHRKIIGFNVCTMPARGIDANRARRKYGFRPDHRRQALKEAFERIQPIVSKKTRFHSDEKALYPPLLRECFRTVSHHTYKGRRGCVVGQGELKRGGRDPLFPLNHTAAMLRANLNRLFRRTWCTTKKRERLRDHIELYMAFHNQVLTERIDPATQRKGAVCD